MWLWVKKKNNEASQASQIPKNPIGFDFGAVFFGVIYPAFLTHCHDILCRQGSWGKVFVAISSNMFVCSKSQLGTRLILHLESFEASALK